MKIQLQIAVLLMLAMFTQTAVAFGVTSPYWDTNPLELHPGESKDVQLLLQNMVGDKDLSFSASISEGTEIALLIDEKLTYNIPFGTKDVPVMLRISVPEDLQTGETVNVKVSFKQLTVENSEGQMIQMTGGVGAIIPVKITPWVTPKKSSSSTVLVAGGASLLLVGGIASYMVIRKRRSE